MAGRGRQLQKAETPFPAVHLVLFEKTPYWWNRFWDNQNSQFFFRSTETVDQQKAMALLPKVYQTYLLNTDALSRDVVATVPELIDRFVAHHEGRVRRKEITERTWDAKKSSLKNGMIAYIIEFGLLMVRELNLRTTSSNTLSGGECRDTNSPPSSWKSKSSRSLPTTYRRTGSSRTPPATSPFLG